ncbi:MAG: hypothetical protein M1541_09740, partial [Acidobacteria bacterium]|nr:hypothetical protein [Acidobacteriota bacterium]
GGHGLYSTVGDYLSFIRMWLNDGSAPSGEQILRPDTVEFAALLAESLAKEDLFEGSVVKGKIVGILASETWSSKLDQGISSLAPRLGKLADFLGMAKSAIVKQADPEILSKPGVEMSLKLTKPL